MRPTTTLRIPQPCAERWAAMTPTAAGRHCAACAQTVVDFTLKTDAEILAYLAGAAAGRTCGRFAAGQLERPLQRAAPAAPTARWRAWLAAAVALWGLRAGMAGEAEAQAATEWRARYWGGPVPAAPVVEAAPTVSATAPSASLVVRGVVRDSSEHVGMPGVTVLVSNTQIGVSTNVDGAFELAVPAECVHNGTVEIQLSSVGYVSQTHVLAVGPAAPARRFYLEADVKGMLLGEVVFMGAVQQRVLPPVPWHPRAFYYWGKYWLTRPFRRN